MFSHSLIQSVTICLVIKNEMYELAQHPSLPQEPMKEHVFISSQTRKPPDRTLRKSSLKFSHGRDFAQSSFCSITAPCPPPQLSSLYASSTAHRTTTVGAQASSASSQSIARQCHFLLLPTGRNLQGPVPTQNTHRPVPDPSFHGIFDVRLWVMVMCVHVYLVSS